MRVYNNLGAVRVLCKKTNIPRQAQPSYLFSLYATASTTLSLRRFLSLICEILPYGLCARDLALGKNSTLVALFFNAFVNPIILDVIAWKYYIVYSVILLIIRVTSWFCTLK
ncbi:hypothetical protein BDW68DRAFT_158927 [Aspergillus falconensis]